MNGSCGSCVKCNDDTRFTCRKEGNFYTTGEYSRTLEFFNVHGVSFNQKVESVKMLLDNNTLQILKVLLTESDAPCKLDLETSINIVATLDLIQSRLSNDNKTLLDTSISNNPLLKNNSYEEGDEQ